MKIKDSGCESDYKIQFTMTYFSKIYIYCTETYILTTYIYLVHKNKNDFLFWTEVLFLDERQWSGSVGMIYNIFYLDS